MLTCSKCSLAKDRLEFFPNQRGNKIWCKLCVETYRGARKHKLFKKADKANKEQESLLTLIKQFQPNKESYIYLIQCRNRFKIGYSTNVENRVKTFNTASPFPATIIAVAPGTLELESQLHKEFMQYRVFGEWFIAKDKVINRFNSLDGSMIFLPGYMKP